MTENKKSPVNISFLPIFIHANSGAISWKEKITINWITALSGKESLHNLSEKAQVLQH